MSLWTRWMARSPQLRRLGRYALRTRCPILMYHGVVPSSLSVFNWCHLPVNAFRAQMLYLKAHYRVIPLIEVVERVKQYRPLPESAACITFDDAFCSVRDFAFPILCELSLPFTIFVVTTLSETGAAPWPEQLFSAIVRTSATSVHWDNKDWPLATLADRSACYQAWMEPLSRMPPDLRNHTLAEMLALLGQTSAPTDSLFATLRPEEYRTMTASGLCYIGAHSETHAVLPACDTARLTREVHHARQRLRDEKGYVDIFAYPHGQYNATVLQAVKAAGFCGAVTVEHRLCSHRDSPFEIPRIGVGANCNMDQFAGTLLAF